MGNKQLAETVESRTFRTIAILSIAYWRYLERFYVWNIINMHTIFWRMVDGKNSRKLQAVSFKP
jgi:hypothetical protein